jgi:transposase InsO family protein
VHAELRLQHDVHVGRKRVERLMRQACLSGLHRRRRERTTIRVQGVRTAPDLVERDFNPTAVDRLWCADFERHEALCDRAVMKGHRGPPVAAGGSKLGAA